jgi:hypothetical protein
MMLHTEGDTPALEREAEWIMFNVLAPAYPNHPWSVRAYPNGFFIRHMDFPGNWGMNCPTPSKTYSASAYKKLVIMMAGEWLERAALARAAGDGEQEIVSVEGVPIKAAQFENVVVNQDAPRDAPRPQALK